MFDLSLTRFMRRPVRALISVLLILPALAFAQAQPYPNKPIRLILPFAAGGGADNNARTMTELLSQRLGQPIIIDYKPGAGGTLGANIVAHASPDGYTLVFSPASPLVVAPFLSKSMPFELNKIQPVCQVFENVFAIAVRN